MSSISFVDPNIRALPRSQRVAEEAWEQYRADIIREFRSGGGTGNARALKWIKSQKIPGFDPRSVPRLLSHSIRTWRKNYQLNYPTAPSNSDIESKWSGRRMNLGALVTPQNLAPRMEMTSTIPPSPRKKEGKARKESFQRAASKGFRTSCPQCRFHELRLGYQDSRLD